MGDHDLGIVFDAPDIVDVAWRGVPRRPLLAEGCSPPGEEGAGGRRADPLTDLPVEVPESPEARRMTLARFLRARREATPPEAVGLHCTQRRRTPGLRREEVARASGISVTWYTWLEQGRPISVSPTVLDAVARALALDASERQDMRALAGMPPDREVSPIPLEVVPSPLVVAIVEQLDPWPAWLLDPWLEVLACNRAGHHLVARLSGAAGPSDPPSTGANLLRLLCTDPSWRSAFPEWDRVLDTAVARLRAGLAGVPGGSRASRTFVERLAADSSEFARRWHGSYGGPVESRVLVAAEAVGFLRLEMVSLWTAPGRAARLVVAAPKDPATAHRLRALATAENVGA